MQTSSRDISVRLLTLLDIPSALVLSTLAGWNQTISDWELLLRLEPEGCLAVECDGRIVATATLICYDDQLAWLGMVLTHPDYRKRGFARRLVEFALNIAEVRNIRSVKLDATDRGLPLYESFAFRREQAVERWSGFSPALAKVVPSTPAAMLDLALDREAFGVDRGPVLRFLAKAGNLFASEHGFVMSRPGARASFLGPCVARTPESACLLIERCLALDSVWFWDLFPSNRDAVGIAEHLGFKPERTLVRMVKGQDVPQSGSMIYAGGGFEIG